MDDASGLGHCCASGLDHFTPNTDLRGKNRSWRTPSATIMPMRALFAL
jgi:hypothetical protein